MAKEQLPRQINVLREAEQGRTYSGTLDIKDMPRLRATLQNKDGSVDVKLQLGKDAEGLPFIKGHLTANADLICQRCMQAMTHEIDDDFALQPVLSQKEVDRVPSHYEAVVVDREGQELLPLIEDELILRLPIVAMHNSDDCQRRPTVKKEVTANNPFAEKLKELR